MGELHIGVIAEATSDPARLGRNRLSGIVEVDETLLGGARPRKKGRGYFSKSLEAAVQNAVVAGYKLKKTVGGVKIGSV
jgi:hypothetical protein